MSGLQRAHVTHHQQRHRQPHTKSELCPPAFFITFFSYGPHRHPTATFAIIPESAASRTAPVSRDGPIIRRKTISGGSLTTCRQAVKAVTPHPRKVHTK